MAKKFTKKELKEYRQILLERRGILTGNIDSISGSVVSSDGERDSASGDEADLGAESIAQEFALSLMQNESGVVQKIDSALNRIDINDYGFCDDCGEQINAERLRAIPWTTFCVDCQRRAEAV